MQSEKKFGGRSMRFWDIGGWTWKFWGVSITPNFLPRGGTNRKYFLSVENEKRICIKHRWYTMALFVIVLELPGGRTFEFFPENLCPRSFAFLTNFRRIDFPIILFIDAHSWGLSNFVIIFLIWRPEFDIRGTKNCWDPLIYPPI